MRAMTIEESKKIQEQILIDLDKFCREHDIRYTVAYGTLLGTIRHGGWIPWDDDIDIHMLRPDFERFIREYKSERFELLQPMRPKRWEFFARVVDPNTVVEFKQFPKSPFGVWLTIFPVDNRPDDEAEWQKMKRKVDKYATYARLRFGTLTRSRWRNICKHLTHFIFKPIPLKWINGNIVRIMNDMAEKRTKNRIVWVSFNKYETYPYECFEEYTDMMFGNIKVRGIKGYDAYLTGSYGDYMTPPPKEVQANTTHDFVAYYID